MKKWIAYIISVFFISIILNLMGFEYLKLEGFNFKNLIIHLLAFVVFYINFNWDKGEK